MAIQLGSVLLDACVLAVVMREDTYGYKLTQEVKQIMDVSAPAPMRSRVCRRTAT